ncbi:RNA/RNP complex-1-interacting phosphatase homolog [Sabethes cyaneus]|uniref:RNA/RNP complex-1-interacting phosphatase homolog n=1 Tax=Sabethes cyaneus TaxID=53552 RepID=UPI00237E59CB|nr:RNA/RNP complex-1-interacting phosphatase homolog [Sabethes cyaneus]
MARELPDRWSKYSKFGRRVDTTSFVPLKVPLKEQYFRSGRTGRTERFTPNDAIEEIPNLGLVVDLTNTAKYYNPQEFESKGVQYLKIYTKGHDVPDRHLIDKFIRNVKNFLVAEENKDKLVGVHCTHGLNRTGYFICAYMILVLGYSPKSAISLFNEARTHKMERANYLNSLLRFIPLDCGRPNGSVNNHHHHRSDRFQPYRQNDSNRHDRSRHRSRSPRYASRDEHKSYRQGYQHRPAAYFRYDNFSNTNDDRTVKYTVEGRDSRPPRFGQRWQ